MHQFIIYIGSDDILRKIRFVLRAKCHIGITASDEDNGLILMFCGKSVNPVHKIVIGFDTGIRFIFDDPAVKAGTGGIFSEYVTLYVVFFIKCSGDAVSIDIASQHYGYKFSFRKR